MPSNHVDSLIKLTMSSFLRSILNGYPQAQLWGVLQAKAVLYALADASDAGHALRTMLSSMSTTLTGDGTYFVNGIGSLGERAFIPENNHAIYSCQGDYEITVCSALNMLFTSSFAACQAIEALYIACLEQVFLQNYWATNCVVFQTSISNPSAGIICDVSGVQGYPHPYSKPLGIIVNNMLSSLTVTLEEQRGLVCASPSTCDFTSGGLFITTTVRELLFEGFTDPLVLKYLNLKHAQDNISFACVDSAFASSPSGSCTKSTYSCGKEGVRLLWSNKSLDLVYGITDNNVFFSPYFYRSQDSNEMLTFMTQASIKVMNPVFALHPAWNSNDTNFLKLYQCKGNIIYSDDGVFPKCSSRVDSGLRDFRSIGEIETFHGNGSISYLQNSTTPVAGRIGLYTQNEPFLW